MPKRHVRNDEVAEALSIRGTYANRAYPFFVRGNVSAKKNRTKRATQGHIPNYTDNAATRHDECGVQGGTDAYLGRFDIPCSRSRIAVEGRPFIGDVFNPPDGDTIDEN